MLASEGKKKKIKKVIRRPVSFNYSPQDQMQSPKAQPANTSRLLLNISTKLYLKLKELADNNKMAVESLAKVYIKERIDKEFSDIEKHRRKIVSNEAPPQ